MITALWDLPTPPEGAVWTVYEAIDYYILRSLPYIVVTMLLLGTVAWVSVKIMGKLWHRNYKE